MREPRIGYSLSPMLELYAGGTLLEMETILNIIKTYNISGFVEVGIYEGGLAERILIDTACDYFGIEIDPTIVSSKIKNLPGFSYYYGDCFSPYALMCINDFMAGIMGDVIIYCDGGNKKEEIKIYHKLLRTGDILLTHDYWDGRWDIVDYPDYQYREVTPEDVKFLDDDPTLTRLPDFVGTRLVGWKKC